jgi:transcriptional antiterminator NusG
MSDEPERQHDLGIEPESASPFSAAAETTGPGIPQELSGLPEESGAELAAEAAGDGAGPNSDEAQRLRDFGEDQPQVVWDQAAAFSDPPESDPAATSDAGGQSLDDDDLPPVDDDDDDIDPATLEKQWYILKAQVNRETSVCDTLRRRVQRFGLDGYFGEMLVPTEDVREFTKAGKARIVKRKLYPGYIMVNMALTEDSWWLVRDTPGIGDFTSAGGKPVPLGEAEIDRIMRASRPPDDDEGKKDEIKTSIKHKMGDRVRIKDGNFENFEGEVSGIDERNGRVTVLINIFGRLNPVELDHWQVESL